MSPATLGGVAIRAVFFDVDFTLIYPGPTFQGEGYQAFCARYGIAVDPSRFADAVRSASVILTEEQDHIYDAAIFVRYTQHIIEQMGGRGPDLTTCAAEMYDQWASNQHFVLYDDVPETLRTLAARGLRLGLISNSHRCLQSFQEHFELDGLISAAVSSSAHGYMKPHPSIFEAALAQLGVKPGESLMVGDSLAHDIEGARRVGMRGVLVERAPLPHPHESDVPVVRDLRDVVRYV